MYYLLFQIVLENTNSKNKLSHIYMEIVYLIQNASVLKEEIIMF